MNFDYSNEQRQLKEHARRFLTDHCPMSIVRDALAHPCRGLNRGLWARIAELGWLGAAIPEEHAGVGLGYVELCAIAEEVGRALLPLPFASTLYFFSDALLLAGSPDQQARWLPRIASGEVVGCFAVTEGPGELDSRPIFTRVEAGAITGGKIAVADGAIADVAIVLASEADRPGLFIVELAQRGVERAQMASLDDSRCLSRLSFDAAGVQRLGAPGAGIELTQAILERAAVLLAFEQLGGADRCLEMARDYSLQRYAFGRPIGGFQAVKHRLAEMYVKNELARSNAYHAAWALMSNAAELPLAASAARVAASEAFSFAARENIHIQGGIGVTWEADAHLYLRRARQLSLVGGAPTWWSERLVATLAQRSAPLQRSHEHHGLR